MSTDWLSSIACECAQNFHILVCFLIDWWLMSIASHKLTKIQLVRDSHLSIFYRIIIYELRSNCNFDCNLDQQQLALVCPDFFGQNWRTSEQLKRNLFQAISSKRCGKIAIAVRQLKHHSRPAKLHSLLARRIVNIESDDRWSFDWMRGRSVAH